MRQEKIRKHSRFDEESPEPETRGSDRRDELDDTTELLLEEIDDVLEDNAAEFVRSYVQQGGQ